MQQRYAGKKEACKGYTKKSNWYTLLAGKYLLLNMVSCND